MFLKPVKTNFVFGIQHNKHAAGQSKRQPGDVNNRENFVSGQVTNSNFQVVFKHFHLSAIGRVADRL